MKDIHNYTLKQTIPATYYQGTVYAFEHNKTHARITYVDTPDQEKHFRILFKTFAYNSHGAAHILEHSILAQSQKYPVKNPYLEMDSRSVNTMINAATGRFHTSFYATSYSEKDLYNLMQVISNCVFFPAVIKDERIFRQEGFRKEIDAEGNLTYNGVVYNEMMGSAQNSDYHQYHALMKALLPDSPYSYVSGGDPLSIPQLSYQELCDFYHRFYHPTQAYIIFYGHMDIEAMLTWLDENVLSCFEPQESRTVTPICPFTKKNSIEIYQAGDDENDNAYGLAFRLPRIYNAEENIRWDLFLSTAFQDRNSKFFQTFLESGLCLDFNVGIEPGIDPIGILMVKKFDAKNIGTIKKAFSEVLDYHHSHGFDHKLLKQAARTGKVSCLTRLDDVTNERSEEFLSDFTWHINDVVYEDYDPIEVFDHIDQQIDDNTFEHLFDTLIYPEDKHRWFYLKADTRAMETYARTRQAQIEADNRNLSDADREDFRKISQALSDYLGETSAKGDVDTLPTLSEKDVTVAPFKGKVTRISDKDDYAYYHGSHNLPRLLALFDITDLQKEEITYQHYWRMMLKFNDTQSHTQEEMRERLAAHGLYRLDNVTLTYQGQKYRQNLALVVSQEPQDFEEELNILREYLLETVLDPKKVRIRLTRWLKQGRENLDCDPFVNLIFEASSRFATLDDFQNYTNGLEANTVIENLLTLSDEDLVNRLAMTAKKVLTKDRIHFLYVGEEENEATVMKAADAFRDAFPEEAGDYRPCYRIVTDCEKHIKAYEDDRDVHTIVLVSPHHFEGKTLASLNLASRYLSNTYLPQEIRIHGGAYSWGMTLYESMLLVYSDQDPNLKDTLNVFRRIPGYLRANPIRPDMLTQMKMKAIASYNGDISLAKKGIRALNLALKGKDETETDRRIKAIQDVTIEDIQETASLLEDLLNHSSTVVLGPKDSIEENKAIFDTIEIWNK